MSEGDQCGVDILHPFASLVWSECKKLPVGISNAQAVLLGDRLYMGGGSTSGSRRNEARLYIYTPTTDIWTTLDTPVYLFALITYHHQVVLIGGRKYVGEMGSGLMSNQLWILDQRNVWQAESLPPMNVRRRSASAVNYGEYILVAGGESETGKRLDIVEVYNGQIWSTVEPLPEPYYHMKSSVFAGCWYLMGGIGSPVYINDVFVASLASLIASCQSSGTLELQPSSVWKRLTGTPYNESAPAILGSRLMAIGGSGGEPPVTSTIHVFSPQTKSWIEVGNLPAAGCRSCAKVLSRKELIVIGGFVNDTSQVFKATVQVKPFDQDSYFSIKALHRLEACSGISVLSTLDAYLTPLHDILGFTKGVFDSSTLTLSSWRMGDTSQMKLLPTWKNLLWIINQLNLVDLAQQVETKLKEAAVLRQQLEMTAGTGQAIQGKSDDSEMEAKLCLQEEHIHRLKQQIGTMQWRIEELEYENEHLRSQHFSATVKEEEKKPILLNPVKTEEPHILEGEPFTLLSVKREVKEEAVPVTKAETTSAQSTTATWNLRGVEVCGEMTVVIYSSHDQQITWPGYGLRLNIPKGCLPAGMEQCTINIKASLAGQYEFPENSHPVSAVIWFRCEDVHKFTRPITVEIQHCAKSENVTNLKLSFVRTVCSQKQLPYTFKQLAGGNFTSHSSYGFIELNSFSGVGVTQEGSEDREYCSQLFYLGQPDMCKIHFVVTWNVEAHLTEIVKKYEKERAILGLHQPVEFEADTITLDIPMEGLSIKGWKITPLIRPVVTKKQVDNFREGKLTPCCQLLAEVSGKKKKIPTLKHQVNLRGAKYPNDVFVINLPAGVPEQFQTFGDLATIATPAEDPSSQPTQTFGDLAVADHQGPPPKKRSRLEDAESAKLSTDGSSTAAGPSSASGLDTKLSFASHFEVCSSLQLLDDNQILSVGGALGLAFNVLRRMKVLPDEMVAAWLRREDYVSEEPTWRALLKALRRVGQSGLAQTIENDKR